MSKLYDEALADANKIRELAVQEARNKILEQITPVIRRAISAEISSGKTLLEQEELQFDETEDGTGDLGLDTGLDAGNTGADMNAASVETTPASMGGDASPAPVQPQNDIAGLQLPDEDGKIVVDFDQLFVQTDDNDPEALPSSVDASSLDVGAPAEQPALPSTNTPESQDVNAAAGQEPGAEAGLDTSLDALAGVEAEQTEPTLPETRTYEGYKTKLSEVSNKIDRAFFRKNTPRIVFDSLKNQLFSLVETLDYLRETGEINAKKQKNEENKLEFLNLKLKEAKSSNSYGEEKGKTTMATLKEMAAKLFEEENLAQDSDSTGDTGVPTDDKATSHAQSVDGADDVDLMKEESTNSDLEDAGSPFGDGSEASGAETASKDVHDKSKSLAAKTVAESEEFEVEEEELREVFRRLKKENIARLKKALKEADEGGHALDLEWEEGGAKIGNTDKKKMAMAEDMDLGEYSDMGEGDLAIDIDHDMDSDMEGEDEFLLTVNGMDLDLSDLGDDEELEVVDDAEGLGASDDFGGDDLDSELGGDELGGSDLGDEGEEMLLDDELVESIRRKVVSQLKKLQESKTSKKAPSKPQARKPAPAPVRKPVVSEQAKKMVQKALLEKKNLEKKLQEERLTTAKLVYANRLFAREDVTKTQKIKIAEFLDNAKSLAEAKDVYLKVEKVLNEKASKGQKMPGSTSATTKSGSPSAALRESSYEPAIGSFERWQVLSGIKKKDAD
jgi:hypothetical protein